MRRGLNQPMTGADRRLGRPLLLYDARHGLCRRFVSLVIRADRAATISIASLVGREGAALLREHPVLGAYDSAIWIPTEGPALVESDAILAALDHVGGLWSRIAGIARRVPLPLRTAVYGWFARRPSRRLRLLRD